MTLSTSYGPTQRALIQTRTGEIDYGEHDKHGFVKSTFLKRGRGFKRDSAITLLKHAPSTQRALIRTRRGEIDYGEHDRHGFVKSMF